MSWVPTTDFEEEIVCNQPYNFIYGTLGEPEPEVFYPRPKSHLEYAAKKNQQNATATQQPSYQSAQSQKLRVIAKVQRIARTKPLGEQPSVDDWNDNENIEKETVAMMRHFGLGPSVEEAIDEKITLPTLPINEEMHIMHSGKKRIPIFFDEKFFKLKPRDSDSSLSDDIPHSSSSTTATVATAIDTNSANTSLYSEISQPSSNSNSSHYSDTNNASYSADNGLEYESFTNSKVSNKSNKTNTSQFETALEDEISFRSTSITVADFIPTCVWYRKNYHNNTGSSTSSSTTQHKYHTKKQKVFTAKELYEKKRLNK